MSSDTTIDTHYVPSPKLTGNSIVRGATDELVRKVWSGIQHREFDAINGGKHPLGDRVQRERVLHDQEVMSGGSSRMGGGLLGRVSGC